MSLETTLQAPTQGSSRAAERNHHTFSSFSTSPRSMPAQRPCFQAFPAGRQLLPQPEDKNATCSVKPSCMTPFHSWPQTPQLPVARCTQQQDVSCDTMLQALTQGGSQTAEPPCHTCTRNAAHATLDTVLCRRTCTKSPRSRLQHPRCRCAGTCPRSAAACHRDRAAAGFRGAPCPSTTAVARLLMAAALPCITEPGGEIPGGSFHTVACATQVAASEGRPGHQSLHPAPLTAAEAAQMR